ncbi:MAG: tyrosinase family protein [Elusimicrobia bacterium]|nr:tyrosinase family protein [Elusimicrobiota bacterium]
MKTTPRHLLILGGATATLLLTNAAPPAIANRAALPAQLVQRYVPRAPKVLPRLSWSTFLKDAHRVSQLKKAIAYMKSLNGSPKGSANYRRSWEYWANIHGYYGYAKDGTTPGTDGTVEQAIAGYPITGDALKYYDGTIGPKITDQTAPDDLAMLIWATCQHSDPGPPLAQANFFAWHRMYLYYFEQVLQWAAGRPGPPDMTLRLPYWDYINPASLALPAPYQSTVPFVEVKRAPGMNTGTKTLKKTSTNVNTLLTNTVFLGSSGFEFNIEYGIHGYVHCTVGLTCPAAYMGDVPVAANDPVFYSHHAEIDRIWACWQKLHGLAGPPEQTFTFVDASGNEVTKKVSEVLDTKKLGYTYESTDCTQPGTTLLKMPTANVALLAAHPPVVGSVRAVPITNAVTTINIPVQNTPHLLGTFKHLDTAQTFVLTLRDVTASAPPGVLFDVYVAKTSDPAQRQQVGTISWFGAFGHHGMYHPARQTLTYDVTAALRALGVSSLGDKGATVVVEAATGRAGAGVANAERTAAAGAFQAASARANVQIGAVELHSSRP